MALEARGFTARGRRTVLSALPDSQLQRAGRWLLLVGSVVAVVVSLAGMVRVP